MLSQVRCVLRFWKSIFVVVIPVALCPLILSGHQESKCAYVILNMAIFWMMDLLPLSAVALIPVFAFPLLGILSSHDVSTVYMVDTNMLFIGGLMVAVAVEHCNLHKRIALYVILKIGQSPRRLMAGFMITTMFLSMWISNTASTAMMVPIIQAIMEELFKPDIAKNPIEEGQERNSHQTNLSNRERKNQENGHSPAEEMELESDLFESDAKMAIQNMLFLSVAYSANIGGTGALTGTGPNLVFSGIIKNSYPSQKDITFTSWMIYNVPGMLICTFIGWIWLQVIYIGCGKKSKLANISRESEDAVKRIVKKKYDELGPITFHQVMVLFLFICLVLLWLFREPGFIFGWSDAFEHYYGEENYKMIDDGAPAIMIAVLFFVFPKQLNFWPFKKLSDPDCNKPAEGLVTWPVVHRKLPWGLVLLIGSGFAMASASKQSGLSAWLGEQFRVFDVLSPALIVPILCLIVAMVTEVASNTATASILMPVLNDVATSLCINPFYFMLPATICCSFAFMLPVATPPNAIVFGASGMKTREMMKVGLGMNILCIAICTLIINTYGVAFFDLNSLPEWMNTTDGSMIDHCYNSSIF